MPFEIERKFLVRDPSVTARVVGTLLRQGYVGRDPLTVRVRVSPSSAWLTLKGLPSGDGRTRPEFEYPIPLSDALELLGQPSVPLLEKTRYPVVYDGHTWDVDVYHGALEGLVTAEIELEAVDEAFSVPAWVGAEVTGLREWDNEMLARNGKPVGDKGAA